MGENFRIDRLSAQFSTRRHDRPQSFHRQQPFAAETKGPKINQVGSPPFRFGLGRKKSGV
jgi:hypothetical protein